MSAISTPDVPGIERFWRAANYVTLCMLYLRDNPLLGAEVQPTDFKRDLHGHWGVCPAVTAVYGHVSDLARRKQRRISLVIGAGHAGPAMLACLFLDRSLASCYPEYSRDAEGLTRLINAYGSSSGFPTEISANYPGIGYVGGELGSALAFSQGAIMGEPQRLVVCVIGDGELETSTTQASFQGFDLLNRATDGAAVPVINVNGYRMGSRSLWSLRDGGLERFLSSHGLTPIVVGPDHAKLADAFDQAYEHVTNRRRPVQPVIVLRAPKGWSAPDAFGATPFAGSRNSHKLVLRHPAHDRSERDHVAAWLLSYDPATLFDEVGQPLPAVTTCLPPPALRLGRAATSSPPRSPEHHSVNGASATAGSAFETLRDGVRSAMLVDHEVFILSPDELRSNRFASADWDPRLKHGCVDDQDFVTGSRVVEILNENLCFAWACGLAASGRRPILISYEAFAPVFASQADQLVKFLAARRGTSLPKPASVNVILTSLGWHNTPTHHNPGFVDSLLGRDVESVRVYMPVLAHSARRCLRQMLASTGLLNVLVVSKTPLEALSLLRPAHHAAPQPRAWVELASDQKVGDRITLVAIGDVMAEQALLAKELINAHSSAPVTVIALEDLTMLHTDRHPDWRQLHTLLTNSRRCLWIYNGRPNVIKGLLHGRHVGANAEVLGYVDRDQASPGHDRLRANGVSPDDIAERVLHVATAGRAR